MARHILQGERPVFFYGQAYMGSLDAWLIAVGFRLLGDSVLTIRIVESILYLLIVATGFAVALADFRARDRGDGRGAGAGCAERAAGGLHDGDARRLQRDAAARQSAPAARLGRDPRAARIALALGAAGVVRRGRLVDERADRRLRAAGRRADSGGMCGGEMAHSTSVAGAEVRSYKRTILGSASRCVFFLIGSAPWWAFNFAERLRGAALLSAGSSTRASPFAGTDIPPLPTDQRLIGLFLLGLPAVIGLRFPWLPAISCPSSASSCC